MRTRSLLLTAGLALGLAVTPFSSRPAHADGAKALLGKATPTGVLDLETLPLGDQTMLRDGAYTLIFPWTPKVSEVPSPTPDGSKLLGAMAIAMDGNRGVGLIMLPIPKGISYDVKVGTNAARDGILAAVKAKLTKETATKVGGLAGRRVLATASLGAQKFDLELRLAWDPKHHTMIGLYSLLPSDGSLAKAPLDAYFASFKVKPGAAPPAKLVP